MKFSAIFALFVVMAIIIFTVNCYESFGRIEMLFAYLAWFLIGGGFIIKTLCLFVDVVMGKSDE